ncbi:macrolide 2'-phosphotransferase [Lentzea alba]|uniref:macrolide 2'-phosphotransferase n=1 Tax=Lentzea alba TaxID=2714351 RepID=UPI0039BFB2F1
MTDLREFAVSLELRPGSLIDSGGDFLVLHAQDAAGDAWILRQPRREWALQRMGPERALLDLVADRVPVPVPRWRPDVADVAVYRALPGASPDEPEEEYFEDVARFLAALHAIPLDEAALTGVQVRTPDQIREIVALKIHRARTELGLSDVLWRHWQAWLEDSTWPPHSVVAHADMSPANTLVDNGKLSGVIDWTDSLVGDPAADFRRLVKQFGRLDSLLDAYERHGGRVWPGMKRHIEERSRMAPIDSGLYGIDSGQDRYVRTALERLALLDQPGA